jgi:uncharacterized protein YjbJ (UPF0337 family)
VEGTANKIAGRIQDAAGALTGDAEQQVKGKLRAAAGDAQATASDALEQVREWIAERPITVALITAGVAYMLGKLSANRD